MVKVTNTSQISQDFHVNGGKAGEPKFVSLRPGESDDLDLADRKSAQITSREMVGAIAVGDKAGKAAAAVTQDAHASPPAGSSKK